MKEEIEEFINRRFKVDCNWMNGNCYHFAVILTDLFDLQIVYLPIPGHFVAMENDNGWAEGYYDWEGYHELEEEEVYYPLDYIEKNDKLLYKRLMEDCMY